MTGPLNPILIKTLIVCAILLFLPACDVVYTEQPMGAEAVSLDEATWQGTWISEEIVVLTTVLDADKGLLQAAWLERGSDGARYESFDGTVRRSGTSFYLNFKPPEAKAGDSAPGENEGESEPSRYLWARIELNGRKAVVWPPDVEAFSAAVSEDRLPGRLTDGGDVILSPLDYAQQGAIDEPGSPFLQWSSPLVFIRIGN